MNENRVENGGKHTKTPKYANQYVRNTLSMKFFFFISFLFFIVDTAINCACSSY